MTTTPNMGLIQPTVGVDSGATWESSVNSNSSVIDQHNHAPGYGVPITPSGLNINATLPMGNNSLTGVLSTVYQAQSSVATLKAMYVIGNDLYFNDGAGNVIQITSGGTVNATSSGIASGTATASFVSSVLVVNAAANTPANIQGGSILLGNNVANSKFLTLAPPAAMGSNITETLPTIPGATSIMQMDSSGNMSAVLVVDNSTLQNVANTLSIKNLGVTAAKIANATITTTQISGSAGITGGQLAAATVAVSNMASISNNSATGSAYTNTAYDSYSTVTTVNLTGLTGNRPLLFSVSGPLFSCQDTTGFGTTFTFQLYDSTDSIVVATWTAVVAATTTTQFPANFHFAAVVAASTNSTFILRAKGTSANPGSACSLTTPSGVTMNIVQV